ncbi:stage V sporulation protein T [Haloimpatiens massiliensis]|uniref:stage V sporulation protein T n=1 Tax=Haloimpatiens massiliensis TaxID=1658110 RepID=UPI000C83B1F6|nr:stage V sporulation protein T [Haloimpatiens massiliensis]
MKATGIVRRIDDLGRVVIPKEIRRTLRIREGDPLEIFTDREGGIILKKYSPINELTSFSNEYAEALNQSTGNIVIICDKDSMVSVSGTTKKEYLDKRISNELGEIIESRKNVLLEKSKLVPLYEDEEVEEKYFGQVIAPIIAEGDAIGAVILISKEENKESPDLEIKLAQTASTFLGKQME